MSTTEWIVIGAGIAVLVVVALLLAARVSSSRRRAHLRGQFGPEYDRTVETAGSRRQAERELSDRESERAKLDLKPLSEAARTRFNDEWQTVQQRFVDDPEGAAAQAERLVRRVMDERGYPADNDTTDRTELVSVDHPDVVDRYRSGCEALEHQSSARVDRTEDLRVAMVDFRAVFESLLETDSELAALR